MTKNIALCGIDKELISTLEPCGEYRVLCFFDEPERRGDVKLAYYLRDGPPVDLAIVGYPGAEGLAACDYLRTQNHALPIVWLCDRKEFEPEAKRIGVTFYGIGSFGMERLVKRLLSARLPFRKLNHLLAAADKEKDISKTNKKAMHFKKRH